MAKGIRLPIKPDKNGRLALLEGDEYIQQLVRTGLGEGDSENPFQDVALGEFMIFGINDNMTNGEIREAIAQMFSFLEADQLAKLDDPLTDLAFSTDTGPIGAEKKVNIAYTNMETQERVEFAVPLPPTS